jgi:hypothetical protein
MGAATRDTDEKPLIATKAPSHEEEDLNCFSFCGALRLRVLVAGLVGHVSSAPLKEIVHLIMRAHRTGSFVGNGVT